MTFKLTEKQQELKRDVLTSEARHGLVYGGSRSGKTFLIVFAIVARAIKAPGSRHAIFRKHGVAVKQSIGQDTLPKVLELACADGVASWKYHKQDGYYEIWTEGNKGKRKSSEIWLSGLDDKERVDKVLGKEFCTIYLNEASEISYQSFVTVMSRLAQVCTDLKTGKPQAQKCWIDLNPTTKVHWTYKLFVDGVEPESRKRVDSSDYVVGQANPLHNLENLDKQYVKALQNMPARQKKRFSDGEYAAASDDALWKPRHLQRIYNNIPDMARIVVAIDPATSTEAGSDETGIIVAGIDGDGLGYVLEDASDKHQPEDWASIAVNLFKKYDADLIVGEKNQGGDMIEALLRAQEANVPYRGVTATRGKYVRAEPIAQLYERQKVYHVGEFDTLEEQMQSFTVDFDRKGQGYSPDRVDALVWAFTELFPQMTQSKAKERVESWMNKQGHIMQDDLEYDPLGDF